MEWYSDHAHECEASLVGIPFRPTKGQHERAVELYALASRYRFVAKLPPQVAEAARKGGQARDLDATVRESLAELEA